MLMSQIIFSSLDLYLEMAPWLLIGCLTAGLIGVFFSKSYLMKHLSGGGMLSLLKATVFGVPLPLCSCSVIPTGLALHKQGASKGSCISFIVSTPQTGIDSMWLTAGVLGWPFTILKVISSIIMGIIAGHFSGGLNKDTITADCPHESNRSKFIQWFESACVDIPRAIALPFLGGVFFSGLLSSFLEPNSLGVQDYPRLLVYLFVLISSIPLYVCTTASVPLALLMIQQGFDYGAVLIFLMAGPVTNIATILIIYKNLGKRAVLSYVLTVSLGSLLIGFMFGHLIEVQQLNHIHHEHVNLWSWLASSILFILFLPAIWNKFLILFKSKKELTISEELVHYELDGLTCENCISKVEKAFKARNVKVFSLTTELLSVQKKVSSKECNEILNPLGFKIKSKQFQSL